MGHFFKNPTGRLGEEISIRMINYTHRFHNVWLYSDQHPNGLVWVRPDRQIPISHTNAIKFGGHKKASKRLKKS